MKRILSVVASIAMVAASFTAMMTSASAETITNVYEAKNQTIHCKCGSYYVGDLKFLTNNTPPEEGNPFENQYMAEEANGKYLVVEATLESVTAVADTCPDPSEITLAVVAQSDVVEWGDSCNGYPNFTGIGDTIKLSTLKLSDEFSVTPDEYWQFTIQLGLTDESPAKINGVKGQSKFDAVVSLKSYISDTPCLTAVHLGANDSAAPAANSSAASTSGNATSGSTTTNTSGAKTSSNSSTGFGGLVAIPAVAAVFGVVASKKRS